MAFSLKIFFAASGAIRPLYGFTDPGIVDPYGSSLLFGAQSDPALLLDSNGTKPSRT